MLVCSSGILVILVWLILAHASDTSAGDTAVGDTGFADDILPRPELRYPYMIQLYNYSKNNKGFSYQYQQQAHFINKHLSNVVRNMVQLSDLCDCVSGEAEPVRQRYSDRLR